MLHYLQELFRALDVASLGDAALRVAAIFLCLTVHKRQLLTRGISKSQSREWPSRRWPGRHPIFCWRFC